VERELGRARCHWFYTTSVRMFKVVHEWTIAQGLPSYVYP
jgi:hypothetical protein